MVFILFSCSHLVFFIFFYFFFNDTATTEIYTLSLHDALPIPRQLDEPGARYALGDVPALLDLDVVVAAPRSEEHTSELQSPCNLVCRLLLEKKKKPSARNTSAHRTPAART